MHGKLHQGKKSQAGFTLVEAVVAAAVFAFIVSSVIGVYLAVVNIDSKTRAARGVQQSARFIMDFLGKEIRNGSINYADYPSGTITYGAGGYATEVRILNQLNEEETVACNGTNLTLTKTSGVSNLNAPGVLVTRCEFFISPSTTPFANLSANPPDTQPFVTVVLQLTSNYNNRLGTSEVMDLQSTFTVRDYPSRE
jgi:hypothetical protein